MGTETTWAGARVCDTCRVLVVPDDAGGWMHPPQLREKFSRDCCDAPVPGPPARGHALRWGRGKVNPGPPVLLGEIAELRQPPGVPLTVGVDGSYRLVTEGGRVRKPISWGYVSICGLYGMGTVPPSPGSVIGGERALQGELGAIWQALTREVPDGPGDTPARLVDLHPIEILTDSLDTVELVDAWQAGEEVMPKGYSIDRPDGRQPTLVKLALLLNEFRDTVRVRWVPGHSGVPLNEGADALAKLARAWSTGRITRGVAAADARRAVLAALTRHAQALNSR